MIYHDKKRRTPLTFCNINIFCLQIFKQFDTEGEGVVDLDYLNKVCV